ncbi:MAG: OmcA/MtrC family decaheme c-type cytochrome [Acidobacteria bacterium]|nr:OmcA/MtrC family decaheme c-type cytochrome [Acidobacteriota bacterium]
MNSRKAIWVSIIFVLVAAGIIARDNGIRTRYGPNQKAYYLTEHEASFIRPGLKLDIQKVSVTSLTVTVTFRIADSASQGLDRLGVETPGPVSTSFVLARIRPGDTQYTNYFTNPVTTVPVPDCTTCGSASVTSAYPAADSGGVYASLGNGVYTYTFGNRLPANFEANATHTLAIYSRRDLTEFGFPLNSLGTVANAIMDFVPSGVAVTQVRDVVRTENCNQCHNSLALHGGTRREIRLCILCHNPSNTDPYTGNSLDAKVYIHKIHMGAFLPSVSGRALNILGTSGGGTATTASGSTPGPVEEGARPAGTPYEIIGRQRSIHDYSNVVWPQDVRNCTTCHQKGTQSDNWKNSPSRAACGSCHDDVDFATGANHAGVVQTDDRQCGTCHPPDGAEFDLSVAGAHTMPWKSTQLAGLKLEITGVTGTNPGDRPTVSFKASDKQGNAVDATKLTSLAFILAGPTTDYTFVTRNAAGSPATENALATVKPTLSEFTYTFTAAIPRDAKGSFAIGATSSRAVTIRGPRTGQSFPVNEFANNPVYYFSVDGSEVAPRRQVVDTDKCNVCHDQLALHGGSRRNAGELCQMCHNPAAVDDPNGSRAAGRNVPPGTVPQSINFRFMPHRIHSGEGLTRDFTIYRTNGVYNYNGLRFPGDRRDCGKCHMNNSNQLPTPEGMVSSPAPREFYSPLGPAASACLGCHDTKSVAAHTYSATTTLGESCSVCHGERADFAVSKMHAR